METALVKKQRNVILTDGAVKPTVKPKQWLFIELSDQLVSWPQSAEYENACKENGGKFVKSDKEAFRCGETPYEVSNFGTCVGGSLCLENTTSYHETIGEIFKMKMIEARRRGIEEVRQAGVEVHQEVRGIANIG